MDFRVFRRFKIEDGISTAVYESDDEEIAAHESALEVHSAVFMAVLVLMSALDLRFALAAAANCARALIHSSGYSTSSSLTRISVPPVACNW